ncbi:MAG TPA: hypothetical protein VEI07_25475 [Planctomycetaceae bacterium]|nr:hypothetical protein [Planctomycetaceae bacterium]
MSLKRLDIFHCQKCGRTAYWPHAADPPMCCGEPMACAAPNVAEESAQSVAGARPSAIRGEGRNAFSEIEHVVLEEVSEFSKWCHGVVEDDGSKYSEFAHRLQSLRELMLDRFDAAEHASDLAKITTLEPRLIPDVARLRQQHLDLLERLDLLIHDLLQGEQSFRGWGEVCDRFDSFASDCRKHEQAEVDLVQAAVEEDLGTAD